MSALCCAKKQTLQPLAALLGNAAGDARATTAQGRRLIGVIITARVDHYRAAHNVGQRKVWRSNSLRGFAAGINGKYWHVALMTLALWPEVFAGVGRIVMASRCQSGRRLTIWSVGGTTIWIDVDMKAVVTRW